MADSSYTSPTTKPLYKGTQIVWYVLGLLEFLLGFRFAFKLLGASPNAGFVNFVYSLTQIFVMPFSGIFPRAAAGGVAFEWASLLAMLVYFFVAWAVVKLFLISKTVSTPEAAEHLKNQEDNAA